MDDNGNKKLDFDEFKKGLHDYNLEVSEEDAKGMFQAFEKDKNGSIDLTEFLEGLRPLMSESRIKIINQVFHKLDKNGVGVITVADFKGVYTTDKVKSGGETDEDAIANWLKTFDSPNDPDGVVTLEEFTNYYSGVSANIDDDAYFDLMMRKAWQL